MATQLCVYSDGNHTAQARAASVNGVLFRTAWATLLQQAIENVLVRTTWEQACGGNGVCVCGRRQMLRDRIFVSVELLVYIQHRVPDDVEFTELLGCVVPNVSVYVLYRARRLQAVPGPGAAEVEPAADSPHPRPPPVGFSPDVHESVRRPLQRYLCQERRSRRTWREH